MLYARQDNQRSINQWARPILHCTTRKGSETLVGPDRRTLQVAGEAPLDAGARGDFCSCGRLGQAVAPRHDSIIMLGHDPLFTHMPWPALLDKMKLWLG